MGIGAANAPRRLGRYPAGTHGTDPAAYTVFTELALGSLILFTVFPGFRAGVTSHLFKLGGICFHLFNTGNIFKGFHGSGSL
jgi:hypothetical protein